MGIQLNPDEMREFLRSGHTGILTTLRRDGFPVTLPTFYVTHQERIYISSPARTKKMSRIRYDPRASFLVESGLSWAELKAVMLYGRISRVEDEELCARVNELMDAKYRAFRTPHEQKPEASQQHYASIATLCFEPEGEPISWDNSKLRRG